MITKEREKELKAMKEVHGLTFDELIRELLEK